MDVHLSTYTGWVLIVKEELLIYHKYNAVGMQVYNKKVLGSNDTQHVIMNIILVFNSTMDTLQASWTHGDLGVMSEYDH